MFVCLLALIGTIVTYAIPARPIPFTITQPDGTQLTIRLKGDEHFHFATTDDRIPIVLGNDNQYYYAAIENDKLVSSKIAAHNESQRTDNELKYIQAHKDKLQAHVSQKYIEIAQKRQHTSALKAQATENNTNFIGDKKGLVILVNFSNKEMVEDDANDAFNKQFNLEGYDKNGHIGSVHDYFYDQSYGQFNLTFDVVGPVTVSKPYSYYGSNDFWGDDKHPGEMIIEACKLANEYVNFADYDWDGDGEVEQVYVIYAGYGEASGAPANTIWPHEYSLTSCKQANDGTGALHLDGVKIDTYACSCELAGRTGNTIDGIGTACHEFSHCMGFPDFYDVSYSNIFGMDAWDVMDYGAYSGPENIGEVPCGYTAYERWFAGWLKPIELSEADRIENIPNIGDEPVAYVVYNDKNRNEYFTLENRQSERWFSYVDTYTDCHGLLITHVDYSASVWDSNNVNTSKKHPRMSVVVADNSYSTSRASDYRGDLFPGAKNVTEFTNTSHVNVGGKLYNKNTDGKYALNKPITNIEETDGLISFDFMGGIYVPTPIITKAYKISANAFAIDWNTESEVDSYTVEISEVNENLPDNHIVIEENFQKLKDQSADIDATSNIAQSINQYTQSDGWSGKYIYASDKGVKIGNTQKGYITTPTIPITSGGITIKFSAQAAGSSSKIYVSIADDKKESIRVDTLECKSRAKTYIYDVKNIEDGKYQITIEGSASFYLSNLVVYDGNYSKKEVSVVYEPERIVVTDIVEQTQLFENLKGTIYKYRVKAVVNKISSEWTDYGIIELTEEEELQGDSKYTESEEVTTSIDAVPTISDGSHTLKIYNINGMRVERIDRPGLYIVDDGNKKIKLLKR